jgi:hypothetical protein
MDGINKKNGKRIMRPKGIRSFDERPRVTMVLGQGTRASSEVEQIHNKNLVYIPEAPPVNSSSQVRPKRKKFSLNPFFRFCKKIILSKWGRKIGVLVFVWSLLFVIFDSRDTTKITIRPHLEYVDVTQNVLAKRTAKEGELVFEIIAITDEVSISVIASGERAVERYAQGDVTLYNDFSSEPQRLLPGTRFTSVSGKTFKLGDEEVIIPGKTEEAGTTTTTIYAELPGPQYNIASTDFTIPGFKEAGLDEKYNTIYAFSSSAFENGFVGTESYITEEQSDKTISELQKKLVDRLSVKLEKEKTDALLLVKDSARITYHEPVSVFGEEKETGLITGQGTILSLAVGKDHLEEFLNTTLFEEENIEIIDPNSINVRFGGSTIDFKNQQIVPLVISGSPLFSWVISKDDITNWLAGVEKDMLISLFEGNKSIDRAELKLRPFWRSYVSENKENIEVILE